MKVGSGLENRPAASVDYNHDDCVVEESDFNQCCDSRAASVCCYSDIQMSNLLSNEFYSLAASVYSDQLDGNTLDLYDSNSGDQSGSSDDQVFSSQVYVEDDIRDGRDARASCTNYRTDTVSQADSN